MSISPNPILGDGSAHLLLSEHAKFRIAARDVDPDVLRELSTAEMADYSVDATSGHLVFRIKDYRIVAKRLEDGRFMVLSMFTDDQKLV